MTSKEILTFDNIEIKNHKSHYFKHPIDTKRVDKNINKTLIGRKALLVTKDDWQKGFIGYKDDWIYWLQKFKPLYIMLPKMSG